MKNIFNKYVIFLSFGIIMVLPLKANGSEIFSLSINPSIIGHERVLAFQVDIKSGGINSIKHVPIGWGLNIDNSASWNTNLSGNIEVGSAALDAEFFNKFLSIEKGPNKKEELIVHITIKTTTNGNFDKEKNIVLTKKDFILTKIK